MTTAHQQEASRCADQLVGILGRYSAEFRVDVFGTPPTLRLELSVGAAHYLLDLLKSGDTG